MLTDLINDVFGKWTVIAQGTTQRCLCLCVCGAEFEKIEAAERKTA